VTVFLSVEKLKVGFILILPPLPVRVDKVLVSNSSGIII